MRLQLAANVFRTGGLRDERKPVSFDSTVRDPSLQPIDATVLDISGSGFRARVETPLEVSDEITLGLPGLGMVPAVVVRKAGRDYGCAFKAPVTARAIAAALAAEPVHKASFPALPPPADELATDKWPVATRVAIIGGGAAALWALIIAAVHASMG